MLCMSGRLPRKVNPTREGVGPFEKENEMELVPSEVRSTSILTCDKRRIYVAMWGRARVQRSRSITLDALVRFDVLGKVLYLSTLTSIRLSDRLFECILSCFASKMRKYLFRAGNILLRTTSWYYS